MPSRTVNARDAGLELISRINRWMIAGAVATTGAVSVAAAKSFHGHTRGSTSSGSTASNPSSSGNSSGASSSNSSGASSSNSSGASSSSGGSGSSGATIQQPSQAPAPAQAPVSQAPAVVSGGS